MKTFYFLLPFLFFTSAISAQLQKCHTDHAAAQYKQLNKEQELVLQQNEQAVQQWISANKSKINQRNAASVVTIPVVFHVVYKNATQNINDTNIFRQVSVLNEAFRLQNANFGQTRPIFDTIAADVEIEFCLATTDPSGNPTNGITRTQAAAGAFFDPLFGFDNVKSGATGGKNPWPNNQYLNVWVCDMSLLGLTVVLGYATFPGGDPSKDGVVIQYQFIGNMPNPTTSNEGKTTVHEVGHWLGLRHIWGDGQGSAALCDSTDYVDDTPNADSASQQTCVIKNTCSNESPYWMNAGIDPPDMYENYMDYSYDACMTMFTQGQKMRMLGFLNTTRAGLLTSQGCGTLGLASNTPKSQVSLYPNPASELLMVNSTLSGESAMIISDLTGRMVAEFPISSGANSIDVCKLNHGVYFYRVMSAKSLVKTGKLVIAD